MICRLCGNDDVSVVFQGNIRSGGAHTASDEKAKVYKCHTCSVEFLTTDVELEDSEYWDKKEDSFSKEKIYEKYDWEQLKWLERIGLNIFRDKVVLDFGCGHGTFLDLVSTISKKSLGIEKDKRLFLEFYEDKPYEIYETLVDIEDNSIDLIVSFDVIEHLQEPIALLAQMRRVLKEGAVVYIGVPNQNDFLKEVEESYIPFYYHRSHLFYHDITSLRYLLERVGLVYAESSFLHKYNIYNMINWLKHERATGNPEQESPFDDRYDTLFKSYIEEKGIASHIIVKATKG